MSEAPQAQKVAPFFNEINSAWTAVRVLSGLPLKQMREYAEQLKIQAPMLKTPATKEQLEGLRVDMAMLELAKQFVDGVRKAQTPPLLDITGAPIPPIKMNGG